MAFSLSRHIRSLVGCTADVSVSFEIPVRRHSFGVSFLSRDRSGTEMYLSLASDWDLDVAFLSAAKPYLQLKMDIKSSEDSKDIPPPPPSSVEAERITSHGSRENKDESFAKLITSRRPNICCAPAATSDVCPDLIG